MNILVILIIINLFLEHFDFSNNNLIDNINDNKLKLKNIDISENINVDKNIKGDNLEINNINTKNI